LREGFFNQEMIWHMGIDFEAEDFTDNLNGQVVLEHLTASISEAKVVLSRLFAELTSFFKFRQV
jgi:hypothetical protein